MKYGYAQVQKPPPDQPTEFSDTGDWIYWLIPTALLGSFILIVIVGVVVSNRLERNLHTEATCSNCGKLASGEHYSFNFGRLRSRSTRVWGELFGNNYQI